MTWQKTRELARLLTANGAKLRMTLEAYGSWTGVVEGKGVVGQCTMQSADQAALDAYADWTKALEQKVKSTLKTESKDPLARRIMKAMREMTVLGKGLRVVVLVGDIEAEHGAFIIFDELCRMGATGKCRGRRIDTFHAGLSVRIDVVQHDEKRQLLGLQPDLALMVLMPPDDVQRALVAKGVPCEKLGWFDFEGIETAQWAPVELAPPPHKPGFMEPPKTEVSRLDTRVLGKPLRRHGDG